MNGKEINLTGEDIIIKSNNFNVDKNGNMTCINANINGSITSNNANITGGKINLQHNRSLGDQVFNVVGDRGKSFIGSENASIGQIGNDAFSGVYLQGQAGGQSTVIAQVISQTSLESQKKNIEILKSGLNIVKGTDIYKYNFKGQKDGDKKHIGFIIGKEYNYSNEITTLNEKNEEIGVDSYSMVAVAYKAIQEQQEIIERQEKKIQELEEKVNELF